MDTKNILKYSFISLGSIGLIMSIYLFVSFFIDFKHTQLLPNKVVILITIFLFFLSYFLLKAGFSLDEFFKELTKTFISFSLMFLSLSIFLLSFYAYSEEIGDSIQPSIDYFLADKFDDILLKQFGDDKLNKKINIVLSDNYEIKTFYVKNLTKEQSKYLFSKIDFNSIKEEDLVKAGKLFISLLYNNLKNQSEEVRNVPLPLNQVKSQLEKAGISESMFSDNLFLLEKFYGIDEDAYIKVLYSENEVSKEIDLSNLKKEDVELIWNNLNFNNNLSYRTKELMIKIILSLVNKEFKNKDLNIEIPIATIGGFLPKNIVQITNYDLFNKNLSIRVQNIESLRNDCLSGKINFSEVCEGILLTKYENLIDFLSNQSQISKNENLPINISVLKDYNTINKIENKIESLGSKWKLFFMIYLILIILSGLLYYLHFKLFNRELISMHVPYYISKINFFYYIFYFLLFFIFTYVFNSNKFLEFMGSLLNNSGVDVNILSNLPLFIVFNEIMYKMFVYSLIYFIFSGVSYLIFYFLLKKEVKSIDTNENS